MPIQKPKPRAKMTKNTASGPRVKKRSLVNPLDKPDIPRARTHTRDSNERPASEHQAAWLTKNPASGNPESLFVDARDIADHIAWRVARYLDDTAPEDRSGRHMMSWMQERYGIRVSGMDGDLAFVVEAEGIVVPSSLISPAVAAKALAEHVEGIDYVVQNSNPSNYLSSPKVLRAQPSAEQPVFYYVPTTSEREGRAKAIESGASQRLEQEFLGLEEGQEAVTTLVPLGAKVAYSKTFTKNDDGSFNKSANSGKKLFSFTREKISSLDEYVDLYRRGFSTVGGQSIRLDDHTGVRRKAFKIDDFDALREPHQIMLDARIGAHDRRELERSGRTSEMRMPTIQSGRSRFLLLDIDGRQMSRHYDLSDESEITAALGELRSALPRSMANAQMGAMLSSSAAMHVDETGERYTFNPVTDTLNCRLFFELDQPIEQENIGSAIAAVIPDADESIYRSVQVRYGPPAFDGADDPLQSLRYQHLEGGEMVDAISLTKELEVAEHQAHRSPNHSRSGPASNVEIRENFAANLARVHEMRELAQASQHLQRALPHLEAIGDRKAMASGAGDGHHFSHLRTAVYAYFGSVFDDDLLTDSVIPREVADARRSEIAQLNRLVSLAFTEAAGADDRETTTQHVSRYLGSADGTITQGGRYAELVKTATEGLAQRHHRHVDELRATVQAGQADPDQLETFVDVCLVGDGKQQVDRQTKSPVLVDAKQQSIWMDPVPGLHDGLHLGVDGKPPAPLVLDPAPNSKVSADLYAVATLAEAVTAEDGRAIFMKGDLDRDAELDQVRKKRQPSTPRPRPPRPARLKSAYAPKPAKQPEQDNSGSEKARARPRPKPRTPRF